MDSMDHQDLGPTVQRIANEVLPAMQEDIGAMQGDIWRIENQIKVLPAMQADIRRLDGSVRRVVLEIVDLKDDMKFVKKKLGILDELKDQVGKLVEVIDSFSGEVRSYGPAKTLHGQSLTEAQVKLNDHERRIKGLEDRLQ